MTTASEAGREAEAAARDMARDFTRTAQDAYRHGRDQSPNFILWQVYEEMIRQRIADALHEAVQSRACRCIPWAPRPYNFCHDCGGRISAPERE